MPEKGGSETGEEVVEPRLVCFVPESCEDMSRLVQQQYVDSNETTSAPIPDADIIDLILRRKRASE